MQSDQERQTDLADSCLLGDMDRRAKVEEEEAIDEQEAETEEESEEQAKADEDEDSEDEDSEDEDSEEGMTPAEFEDELPGAMAKDSFRMVSEFIGKISPPTA